MKEEILNWFKGPRNYQEGVALYAKYGHNRALKARFERNTESTDLRGFLINELQQLGQVPESVVKGRQMASTPKVQLKVAQPISIEDILLQLGKELNSSVDDIFNGKTELTNDLTKQAVQVLAPKYQEVPEIVKKHIRFREEFPFLSEPDCPAELKVLVADMFTAYDKYKQAHAQLRDNGQEQSQDENFIKATEVIEGYLENRLIWAELDHYKQHKEILGTHPIFTEINLGKEIHALPDMELAKALTNARSSVTKYTKALDAAVEPEKVQNAQALLDKWQKKLSLIESEIDSRKK